MSEKLKRVVIKEELVALTKDFRSAILLNQLIYWSERTRDVDKFIQEEKERIEKFANSPDEFNESEIVDKLLTHGWIYKTAEELSDECMVGLSKATIGRYLKTLIDNEWIIERSNPKYKWDRTKQYRVNITKIQHDLYKLGYFLEGYSYKDAILSIFQNETSKLQNEKLKTQNENLNVQNETAIPEITTETTNIHNNRTEQDSIDKYNNIINKAKETELTSPGLSKDENIKNTPAIIPAEYLDTFDKWFILRLKKERKFYGLDFNSGELYNIFSDAVIKTQLQDDVEVLTVDQYAYFIETLHRMLNVKKRVD